jgi:hypothetical protein
MPQLGLGSSLSRGGVLSGFPNTYSLSFDGTDDYVNFGDVAFSGNFTVSAWLYMDDDPANWKDSTNGNVIVGDSANQDWIRINNATTVDLKTPENSIEITHGLTFAGSEWEHFVMTRASDTVTVYRNGDPGGTTGTLGGTFTPEYIGNKGSSSDYFDGKMDEVAIWNVALDADAVAAIYNSRTPIALDADSGNYDNSGNLQGWWRMGDGTESGSGATVYDMSTNSNDGTATNMGVAPTYSTDVPS